MNKIISIIVSLMIVIGSYFLFVVDRSEVSSVPVTEIKDGVQYINIQVRGGYFPRTVSAKADIPTKIVMKTNETYDCSSALVIKSIGYQKNLPPTGETVIDIGTKKTGETLEGVCSMGMYGFKVEFN